MIIDNIMKFGYGDIAIHSSSMGWIRFANIKPPMACGETITNDMDIEYGLTITIVEDEPFELYNIMKTVSEDNRIVEYKGYIFDFSNYNQASVNSGIKGAKNMVNLLPYAC